MENIGTTLLGSKCTFRKEVQGDWHDFTGAEIVGVVGSLKKEAHVAGYIAMPFHVMFLLKTKEGKIEVVSYDDITIEPLTQRTTIARPLPDKA